MNKLFATWRVSAATPVDLTGHLDIVELLSEAQDRLDGVPQLAVARRLIGVASRHVVDWIEADEVDLDAADRTAAKLEFLRS